MSFISLALAIGVRSTSDSALSTNHSTRTVLGYTKIQCSNGLFIWCPSTKTSANCCSDFSGCQYFECVKNYNLALVYGCDDVSEGDATDGSGQ
eukprot:Awhi_evm1s14736